MHDIRRAALTNMPAAGVDKTCRDFILGHSLQGMEVHYIQPGEEALKQAMAVCAAWRDGQLKIVDPVAAANN